MVSEYCKLNLTDAKFSKLSEKDKQRVVDDIDDILKKAAENAGMQDIATQVEMDIKTYTEFVDKAELVKKVNSYRNRMVRESMYEFMTGPFADDPAEGLMAFLAGSQKERVGSRFSVSAVMETYTYKYKNMLQKLLQNDSLLPAFASHKFDLDIRKASLRLDKNLNVDDLPKEAVTIAKHIKTVNKLRLNDANKAGAVVGERDGYLHTQRHNMHRIRANKEKWKSFMRDRLDRVNSRFGKGDFEKALEKQWSEFSSGVHISEEIASDPGKGTGGFASLAKRMSHNRDIVFKTPEDEHLYMMEFSEKSLFDEVMLDLESQGRKIGMLTTLGPNPLMNLDMVVTKLSDDLNKAGRPVDANKLAKNAKYAREVMFPVLTGSAAIPGNEIAATVETILAKSIRMSKLGGASIASFVGEPTMNGINKAFLEGNMMKFFNGVFESFGALSKDIGNPAVMEFLANYNVRLNYMTDSMDHRLLEGTLHSLNNVERGFERAENFFFKWTGMSYLDRHWRYGASMGVANSFATHSSKTFSELPESYQRVMKTSGLDEIDWDMIRQFKTTYDRYGDLIGIEKIRGSELLNEYVVKKDFKNNPYQRHKLGEELITKFTSMINDQQAYSVITQDNRLRAGIFRGIERGSPQSIIIRQMMLLKSWPLAFMQSVLGRTFYRHDAGYTKAINTAGVFIAMTVSGYMLLQLQEVMKGRKPRKMDSKLLLASIAKGGGLGLYGDFVNDLAKESPGKQILYNLAGPSAQLVGDVIDVATATYGKRDAGEAGFNVLKSNVPFANHLILKPVADYMFLNALTEVISPGSLRRKERKQKERYGTDYFMMKPSETMLFKP